MKTLFLGAALSVAAVGFARADSTTITTISPDGKQTVVQKTDSMNIGPGEKPDQALINPNALSPIPNGREVVDAYRAAYEKQNKPRLLLFVNRDLLPEERLATTTRSEKITQVKGDTIDGTGDTNVQIGTGNSKSGMGIVINPRQTGQGGEKKEITTTSTPAPTGDRGVTPLTQFEHRQLEEKFRAPFLAANAKFIDQRIATSLLKTFGSSGDRFLTDPTTDAGKDQLNALKQSADIAIELLARRYTVSYPTPAGDTTITRLDLVATAYDLKQPGLVLAQISSETLFGFNQPGGTRRNISDIEIIDQTSLALMQQLTK